MENEPIRILQWGLLGGRGGIETFIMNLYRNIDRTKVQFDFLEDHNFGDFIYEEEIKSMGGRVFRILYSQKENYKKSKTCLVEFLKEHPEIVGIHVHANFLYASLLRDAKKAGLPIRILHSHSSSEGGKGIRKIIRNCVVRRQIGKYPTAYFACSELAAKYMFPNKKYIWIKNGINTKKFDYNTEVRKEARKKLEIKDEIVLGFVGNLRYEKNPYFVLDVFKAYHERNKNSKLIIVGTGIWEKDLKKYAESNKIERETLFLGSRDDVHDLYQAMDVFLLPSLWEGLGIVLVEAQATGLPCFASDNIPKQVKLTENIEFVSIKKKPEDWVEKIENKLKNYERKSNKKQIIDEGFEMKDVALEVQNFYLDNCGRKVK